LTTRTNANPVQYALLKKLNKIGQEKDALTDELLKTAGETK